MTDTVEAEGSEFLKTAFDLHTERSGLLGLASEYISAGRRALPAVCFYRGAERVMMVTCRAFDGEEDRHRALCEILSLYPAMPNVEALLMSLQVDEVTLKGNKKSPAVLVILVKRNGAENIVYPYEVNVDTGEAVFDPTVEIEGRRQYPEELSHAFATYAFQWSGIGSTKEIIQWLYSKGHEIQFYGDWHIQNIDSATRLAIAETE